MNRKLKDKEIFIHKVLFKEISDMEIEEVLEFMRRDLRLRLDKYYKKKEEELTRYRF